MIFPDRLRKRSKNIFFVALALSLSLFRPSAAKQIKGRNFLVMYPTNNIGDMTCATPVFAAIKKHHPDAKVTVIGTAINGELLRNHPFVDEYILYTSDTWALIKEIRLRNFDAGMSINMDALNIAVMLVGKVSAVSTLVLEESAQMARPFRIITKCVHAITYMPGTYIPERLLQLLVPFGINETAAVKRLAYSQDDESAVSEMLRANGIREEKIVAIAPGAGADFKRWPAERFAGVVRQMHQIHGFRTVVIGGPGDLEAVSGLLSHMKDVPVINPGPLSMGMLKALLARAVLLIGNDSGAVHVAEAVGTPTIAVVGSTDDREHLKPDAQHRVIRGALADEVYQAYSGNEELMDIVRAKKQMERVTVPMVMNGVQAVINFLET